jgi:hypothetical protein
MKGDFDYGFHCPVTGAGSFHCKHGQIFNFFEKQKWKASTLNTDNPLDVDVYKLYANPDHSLC